MTTNLKRTFAVLAATAVAGTAAGTVTAQATGATEPPWQKALGARSEARTATLAWDSAWLRARSSRAGSTHSGCGARRSTSGTGSGTTRSPHAERPSSDREGRVESAAFAVS